MSGEPVCVDAHTHRQPKPLLYPIRTPAEQLRPL